jgi:translation initiation factor 3 subunit D
VLATELKNNSCKLAKWAAQSILAGADQMKVGYVSRLNPTTAYDHTILGCDKFRPKDLAQQINLSVQNMWGIAKMVSELMMKKENGKYVILKDPNRSTIRVYAVPMDTFDPVEEEVMETVLEDDENKN